MQDQAQATSSSAPTADSSRDTASVEAPAADGPTAADAEAAAEAASAAQAKRAADAARLAAAVPAPYVPAADLVQRTDSAISDAAALAVLQVGMRPWLIHFLPKMPISRWLAAVDEHAAVCTGSVFSPFPNPSFLLLFFSEPFHLGFL